MLSQFGELIAGFRLQASALGDGLQEFAI